MSDQTPETKAAQDLVEDAWQFNLKSLVEQHEKFNNSVNDVALQALQNAVSLANRVANNGAETDNMVAKQAFRNVSYENASIWQLPSIDAIAAAVAEKLAATINANIPGGNTLPQGGNPSTGGGTGQ